MSKYIFTLGLVFFFVACKENKKLDIQASSVLENDNVKIPVYDFDGFKPMLSQRDGKTRIINFWATWCKPCVAELPYFELINDKYANDQVEVVLVSLDLPTQVETKLIPFIKRQNLKSKIVLLDDPDANTWIPKVNKEWTGSIPATLIYRNGTKRFFEKSFTYNELEKELKGIR